jgi:peptidoglycan/LPS O-acetylase OafA/YrhL
MFLTLLMVTFVIALLVSFLVSRLFYKPIRQILARLVPEDLTGAWH